MLAACSRDLGFPTAELPLVVGTVVRLLQPVIATRSAGLAQIQFQSCAAMAAGSTFLALFQVSEPAPCIAAPPRGVVSELWDKHATDAEAKLKHRRQHRGAGRHVNFRPLLWFQTPPKVSTQPCGLRCRASTEQRGLAATEERWAGRHVTRASGHGPMPGMLDVRHLQLLLPLAGMEAAHANEAEGLGRKRGNPVHWHV
jgi:hypothetical protein